MSSTPQTAELVGGFLFINCIFSKKYSTRVIQLYFQIIERLPLYANYRSGSRFSKFKTVQRRVFCVIFCEPKSESIKNRDNCCSKYEVHLTNTQNANLIVEVIVKQFLKNIVFLFLPRQKKRKILIIIIKQCYISKFYSQLNFNQTGIYIKK